MTTTTGTVRPINSDEICQRRGCGQPARASHLFCGHCNELTAGEAAALATRHVSGTRFPRCRYLDMQGVA